MAFEHSGHSCQLTWADVFDYHFPALLMQFSQLQLSAKQKKTSAGRFSLAEQDLILGHDSVISRIRDRGDVFRENVLEQCRLLNILRITIRAMHSSPFVVGSEIRDRHCREHSSTILPGC